MLNGLKRSWRGLKNAPPGERFQRYHSAHADADRPLWRRIASIAVAIIIVAVGLVALPAPGPGTLVIVLGAALLGREFRPVAKALDGLELRLRALVRGAKRTWKNASPLGRVGLAVLAAVVVAGLLAAAVLVAYRMFGDRN